MTDLAVLGIDAAWTPSNPSGVAVVSREGRQWRLNLVAGSYGAFLEATGESASLTAAAGRLAGAPPAVVAVDMPLSRAPITGRRAADDAVSRAYGTRKCATHTPSATRPGAVGRDLQARLMQDGYALSTIRVSPPCLIEVYPHPALLSLTGARERLPYKAGRTRSYWPGLPIAERRVRLLETWRVITRKLEERIAGVLLALPLPDASARGAALKAYEDQLDAVVCAWVGIEALEGRAQPYGDETAAIWIPDETPTAP